MVDRREIITICRQIGNMMDAGVDILRITQVLRAQTDNTHLLRIYDQFDHDLRMGASIAEAMTRGADIFSPFMITLVRQAEQRSDLETISKHVAAAFLKIAEFLQQDEDTKVVTEAPAPAAAPTMSGSAPTETAESWPLTLRAIESFTDRLQLIALRALTLTAGLLLSLAAVWWSVEMSWLEKRWLNVTLYSVAALFIGCAGVWVRRQIEKEKQLSERCSFCNQDASEEAPLRPVPGFPGAAICARCAAVLANDKAENDPVKPASSVAASSTPSVKPLLPNVTPVVELTPPAEKVTTRAMPRKNLSGAATPANREVSSLPPTRGGRSQSALADEVSYE